MSDARIGIRSEVIGDHLVIHIQGNMDVHNALGIEEDLMVLIRASKGSIIFDLSGVNFISSAGIRVLVTSLRLCEDLKFSVSLCGLTPSVDKVFDIIGMQQLFKIYPDLKTALL